MWFEQTVGNCGRWRGNDSESCRLAVMQACQTRDGLRGEPAAVASSSGWGVAKYHAAFELMRSEYCDDKLAGMIMFEVRARRRRPLRPRRFMCWPAPFPRARRATRPAFPAPRSPLPAAPPARTQELVLPDPSAADHLFPPRAPSRREGDDADVRDRRDVAGTTNDVFSNRLPDDDRSSDFTDASDGGTSRGAETESKTESTTESKTESKTSVSVDVSDRDRFPALRDAALVFWATDDSRVEDWSTCDWMCSKVLGPYARKHPATGDAARALLHWAHDTSAPPFARRAALVTFVNDVDDNDFASAEASANARFGSGFVAELAATCSAALGVRGGTRGRKRGFAGERDPGETSDPTTDPEAWVRIGAVDALVVRARDGARIAPRFAHAARGGAERRRRAEPMAAFLTLCPYGERRRIRGAETSPRGACGAPAAVENARSGQRGSPLGARGSERRRRRVQPPRRRRSGKKKKKRFGRGPRRRRRRKATSST